MHPLCLFSGVILILAGIYISFQYISARINARRTVSSPFGEGLAGLLYATIGGGSTQRRYTLQLQALRQ